MPEHGALDLQISAELHELAQLSDWRKTIERVDELREQLGPVPELLYRSGFAAAQMSEFRRAHRLMADALLAEFNADWLPWLAAVYDKLGWALPMWPIARWLYINQPDRNGVLALYERAYLKLAGELKARGLEMPPNEPPPINLEMAHKYNVRMVECLQAGAGDQAVVVGEGARLFYPNYQPLLVNLSIAYKRINKFHEAGIRSLYALAVDPFGGGVISNFGSLLIAAGSAHDAAPLLEAGAIFFREDPAIWSNLAVAYNNMKVAPWEAELAARRAIALDDKQAASWSALAGALSRQGRMAESLEAARIVGELEPLRKNESLFNLNYSETLTMQQIAEAHFEAAEARFGQYYGETTFANTRDPGKRLRVGFVSGDLVGHPVAYFIEPVLELLPQHCDVFAYHNRAERDEDEVTALIKGYNLHWHNVAQLSDDELHKLIVRDEIDILVDLSGHSAYHRLPVFARRAAPVQVTYLGYPNTTGLKTMDYFLSHELNLTDRTQSYFSETIYPLDKTGSVYRPLVKDKRKIRDQKYQVSESPCLSSGYVTFGTLNNIAKIDKGVVAAWSAILKRVPTSRLMIESPGFHQKEFVNKFRQRFVEFGIEPDRVILKNRDNSLQYLRYNEIDIALDPFPFGGGTTSCDAIWMGVPLVTLIGETQMSRTGFAIVNILGKPEWATSDLSSYVDIAADLASDMERLNSIRLGLRARMEASPLMDYAAFAQDLANAFRSMWQGYLARTEAVQ